MANFLSKIFKREADVTAKTKIEQVLIDTNTTIKVATPDDAMQISAVNSCVALLSSAVAKLPLEFKRYNAAQGIFVDDVTSPLFYLLARRPSRWHTAYSFWNTVVRQVHLLGNAYAYIDRQGAEVRQIVLLSQGSCVYDPLRDVYIVSDMWHDIYGTFHPEDILHFANDSLSGSRVGQSTISYAARVFTSQATADGETLSRFASGGRIKALFTNDTSVKGFGEYTDDALAAEAAKVESQLQSGRSIVPVTGDGKIHQLNMSSTDLEILNTRKYGVIEIARMFRVPLSKIYSESNNTYNAGETANVEFLVDTIDPMLTKFEQELEVKLLGTNPRIASAYKILFDREKMFTVNSITKADYYLKMEQAGIFSPNDLRLKENMPAVEGGDVPLISCNVAPIGSPKITGEEKNGQPNE